MDNHTQRFSIIKKTFAWIVTLSAIGVFYITLYRAVIAPREVDSHFAPAHPWVSATTTPYSGVSPYSLSMPTLGIRARVESVGLTARGTIGTPSSFSTVAWYRFGPKPGESGLAIIDGHVDNGLGLAGIFKRLKEINYGDTVVLTDKEGKEVRFTVTDIETLSYNDNETSLHATSDLPQVALITCEGVWLKKEQTYNKRLVVIGTLEKK
jgi:sortase A